MTLQARIETLVARGVRDVVIACELHCRVEYVRAAKQRARRRVETGRTESQREIRQRQLRHKRRRQAQRCAAEIKSESGEVGQ